ncbi:MAG TPA: hypothetical protein VNG12_13265, partial [Acidimicrobiales bacterium]|nr:hypothetical protein [Acidimicrobiales bacterium]
HLSIFTARRGGRRWNGRARNSFDPSKFNTGHLSEMVDRVERERDRVVLTRNGRQAALITKAQLT